MSNLVLPSLSSVSPASTHLRLFLSVSRVACHRGRARPCMRLRTLRRRPCSHPVLCSYLSLMSNSSYAADATEPSDR